jgi:lyso-ornithine lipid O-acyltransferase
MVASVAARLRIIVRVAAMILLLLICVPLYYLWPLLGLANPWPRRFLGGIARIAGVRVRTEGTRASGGEFLLVNHVSWIDIPAISAASGTRFVAHDGLASMPLLRWLCAMNGTVFVARYQRASIRSQIEQVRAALQGKGALTIFPEGTTSDGTGLLRFKSSLLSALDPVPQGVAVQPVLLDYGPEAADVAWIGEEHGLDNFKRILARAKPVEITVRFLPPLQGAALANRKTIAAAAREAILAALMPSPPPSPQA